MIPTTTESARGSVTAIKMSRRSKEVGIKYMELQRDYHLDVYITHTLWNPNGCDYYLFDSLNHHGRSLNGSIDSATGSRGQDGGADYSDH